jgi:hypothetical protein
MALITIPYWKERTVEQAIDALNIVMYGLLVMLNDVLLNVFQEMCCFVTRYCANIRECTYQTKMAKITAVPS